MPSGGRAAATFAVAAAIFAVGFASYGSDGVPNQPPALDPIPPQTADELTQITFTATASDPDLPAITLAFSLSGETPSGASVMDYC